MTDVTTELAKLTASTTELTNTVVGKYAALDSKVAAAGDSADEASASAVDAAQSVVDAQTVVDTASSDLSAITAADRVATAASVTAAASYASEAGGYAGDANSSAIAAEASKNQAAQITGLDTVEEAVGLALSETVSLMSETEARAIQKQNEDKYAASGFVHMGKHLAPSASTKVVNEGIWVAPSTASLADSIVTGRGVSPAGTSETDFAVTHIAGAVINLLGTRDNNPNNLPEFKFELPPAEPGTRIYDSTGDARGSGKASLDLKVDVDPKYRDVPTGTDAEIKREAVARAFESEIKNGDFRFGDLYWTKSGTVSITTGGATLAKDAFIFQRTLVVGTRYNAEIVVENGTAGLAFNGGVVFQNLPEGRNVVSWVQEQGSGSSSPILVRSITADVLIKSVAIRPATEEVVTHPVDLMMLEYYEEELTGRQEVFECIQSLSTTFGDTDVPTVLSTRPLSYFQQYDGQFPDPSLQNDQYRCVVWSDLTDEQKRKVAAYMGEKLFVGENGLLVNGRLRARTVRGAGNGDWANVDSAYAESYAALQNTNRTMVSPQGSLDAAKGYVYGSRYTYYNSPNTSGWTPLPIATTGVFNAARGNALDTNLAYKGRCFALVVGTVPRLNQGAYHPSLNEMGTKAIKTISGSGQGKWCTGGIKKPLSTKDTFSSNFIQPYGGSVGDPDSQNGRPDNKLYDGIESSGQGGVIDYRQSAHDMSAPHEASKVWEKVKNGSYRGLEKLVWSKAYTPNTSGNNHAIEVGIDAEVDANLPTISSNRGNHALNGAIYRVSPTGVVTDVTDRCWRPNGSAIVHMYGSDLIEGDLIVIRFKTNLSVSGEFNTQMVIGDPANILQTDALKDGWLGTWCPVIPDGVSVYPVSRKSLDSTLQAQYTDNTEGSWVNTDINAYWDPITNMITKADFLPTGRVMICSYKAFAKQTKPSTNKPVLNGEQGVGSVWASMHGGNDAGILIGESLIGKVFTNGSVGFNNVQTLNLTDWSIDYRRGYIYPYTAYRTQNHAPLGMVAPSNNSPAVKALPYQISDRGQCSLGIQANELTYDGDWGDDSTVKITSDGTATFTDLNGNTNIACVHELAIPFGWSKNMARASEQKSGVDL